MQFDITKSFFMWDMFHEKDSIGSKSLNRCKKAGVNSVTYFFILNDLKETLATFLWFYRWIFQKSWIFVEITAYFIFQLISWCDVIKFLNHKPEVWKSFAWYHIVGIHKLWFSWKSFDLLSTGLEITIVLSFFENFLEFLKKKNNPVILETLKISQKSNGRFTVK